MNIRTRKSKVKRAKKYCVRCAVYTIHIKGEYGIWYCTQCPRELD